MTQKLADGGFSLFFMTEIIQTEGEPSKQSSSLRHRNYQLFFKAIVSNQKVTSSWKNYSPTRPIMIGKAANLLQFQVIKNIHHCHLNPRKSMSFFYCLLNISKGLLFSQESCYTAPTASSGCKVPESTLSHQKASGSFSSSLGVLIKELFHSLTPI